MVLTTIFVDDTNTFWACSGAASLLLAQLCGQVSVGKTLTNIELTIGYRLLGGINTGCYVCQYRFTSNMVRLGFILLSRRHSYMHNYSKKID